MELPPVSPLPSDTPKPKNMMLLIGGGVVALLLIAVGAAALVLQLTGNRSNTIPQLVAGDTQIYAAITPNLNDLPNIDRLRKAFPELMDYQQSETFNAQMKEEWGVTFQEDVAPWIGAEMGVAISGLPFEDILDFEALSMGDTPNVQEGDVKAVILLATRDEKAAQAFLDKQRQYRESKGDQFTSTQTGGITIYTQQGDDTPGASFALVRGHVVFASNAELISAIITRDPSGNETLAANPRFQHVLAALSPDRIGFVFVNGEPLAKGIEANSEQLVADMPEATANQLLDQLESVKALQGVGFSFSVLADGVAFDALSVFDPNGLSQATRDQLKDASTAVSGDRIANVSGDALMAISFRIPASFADQIRDTIASDPEIADQVAAFEQQMDIDLNRDLLDWFQGEASIVLLPGEEIMGSPMPVTGYFAIKPNDRGAAEDGINRLIAGLEMMSGGELGLTDAEVGGVTWSAFSPEGQPLGGYGFVGDDLVIGFGNTALEAAAAPTSNLSSNVAYQAGAKVLPNPNGGMLFINLPDMLAMAEEFGGMSDPEVTDRLAPFKAITAGGVPGMNDKGVTFGRLFLVISSQ
ncbi:hypothetical protein OSCT_2275 [Oscillochloris trichoides DG-6]|uniref:DUF3352 domain-containing protein n=1 Tax=Oscillochloris trichoides DG-6 TaxID=765420 RepID=E1IG11_9CHLR|nr:DUF3352 domain-containing protein [Oscillochloris trichoides]EFO79900.1 hypothetical protein OSCT_2275 [Oscillochloris trichoides DG-6]